MTRLIRSVLVLFVVFVQSALASDVCRRPSFDGMQENKARAITVLSDVTTHDLAKTQVYIEYDDGILYYQSNFISAGSPVQEPAFADVQRVFMNIVFTSPPDPVETSGIHSGSRHGSRSQVPLKTALGAYSTECGHPVHGKLATQSTPNWATHSTPWRTVGA